MNAPAPTLAHVLTAWMQAKEDEQKAIQHRRDLDKIIQDMLPYKDEGSVTQKEGDFKVSVTYKLTRSVDSDRLGKGWYGLTQSAKNAFKWKAEIATANFRALTASDLEAIADYVTTKPASPSVTVERITNGE